MIAYLASWDWVCETGIATQRQYTVIPVHLPALVCTYLTNVRTAKLLKAQTLCTVPM